MIARSSCCSVYVTIANEERLPSDYRNEIIDLLRSNLGNTGEEHLMDANKAGLSGVTLESLRVLRCRIEGLGKEEMDLLMDLTWKRSTPQLARGLKLIRGVQEG